MPVIQTLLWQGQIRSKTPGISSCHVPKCAACLYAKMRQKPWRTNQTPGSVKDSLMVMPSLLPHGPLCPCTASVDHFVCAEQGIIGNSKGRLTTKSFQGGAVFIDTESSVGFAHLQTSLDAT